MYINEAEILHSDSCGNINASYPQFVAEAVGVEKGIHLFLKMEK